MIIKRILTNNAVVIDDENQKQTIENITKENITLSRNDWNAFETSWDFKRNPLV